jgi:hypothetical protein
MYESAKKESEENLIILYRENEILKQRKAELEDNNKGLMSDIQAKDDLLSRQTNVYN